ncbi:hypothetical protein Vadar_014783 [Vaccinium darrowii]|uniref:Uncharacterized protein n=1 Tax=Vaccinium darrowii TaxID=229202 RepID=A0ACB7X9Z1_9ERIC|nr:hypothetical protein Vadar_014783 [Vaccinium darrowii]
MMVLDGLFIIELLSKWAGLARCAPGDPIFKMSWIRTSLRIDLLRLENQIPFFLLQTLFDDTRVTRSGGDDQSLAKLMLDFMKYVKPGRDEILKRIGNVEGKHLLDLCRLNFVPPPQQKPRNKDVQLIPNVEKLDAAGIKFKATKCDTFLEIRFRNGVLEILHIWMDNVTTLFFLNSVAYEQCYSSYCSNHMTAYTTFMALLIKNPSDVGFLCDIEVMENYIGTDKKMVQFFDDMGKNVICNFSKNCLSKVAVDVNEYRRKSCHVQWAGFKHTYFNTPWAFISALAALTLLLLTMIQAFFANY